MPRTVVHRSPSALRGPKGDQDKEADTLPEKLVKYVPAEVLAFFIPASAAAGTDRDALLWLIIAIAVIGTPAYLFVKAKDLPEDKKPRGFFYVLAVLAFLAWAIGTSTNVADLIGVDAVVAGFVLAAAVFLVPLADSVLETLKSRRPSRAAS